MLLLLPPPLSLALLRSRRHEHKLKAALPREKWGDRGIEIEERPRPIEVELEAGPKGIEGLVVRRATREGEAEAEAVMARRSEEDEEEEEVDAEDGAWRSQRPPCTLPGQPKGKPKEVWDLHRASESDSSCSINSKVVLTVGYYLLF